ncbi:galactose oxidase, partial [Jaminaea rosea]
ASVAPAPPPSMYWSKAPVHGSVPKRCFRAHTATLDGETMWLFGGCDSKGCFGTVWCFDVETMCWSRPKVNGDVPASRRAHSATMVDQRLYVFAGGDGPLYFSDLYVFDTVALRWSKPEVFGRSPTARRAHSANHWNGYIVFFGGGNGVGALNDVWLLDVRDPSRLEWREMECTGKMPIGRGYHTGNVVDDKLIVIGGSDGHMSFNDIHVLRLDTSTWYQIKTDEVHNRLGHTSTQIGSYLFVFGGHDSRSYSNEILTLNLVNLQWEARRVCGKRPAGRGYHQAWLKDSRLFVHGGFDGREVFDDLFFLDLAACSYLPQITQFSV